MTTKKDNIIASVPESAQDDAPSFEGVKKLAALARIKIEEAQLEKFTSEFDAILAYISQLEKLDLPKGLKGEKQPLRNVMRADGEPHAAGRYTEKLAAQFPTREGDALSVKQIIQHDEAK